MENARVLNSEVAALAVQLASREFLPLVAKAGGQGERDAWIWGPEGAVTIITSWDRNWQYIYVPESLRGWLISEAGQAWLADGGHEPNAGPEVFAAVARGKLAGIKERELGSSDAAVLEGAAFLRVGDCLYPGAVRFPGFDVSTSGFTGLADEEFSRLTGARVQAICRQIAEALRRKEQGFITQEALDEARTEVLVRWRQSLPKESE